jgi:hypothetical protein
MASNRKAGPKAGERKRDEGREDAGPAYGGEAWTVADEREPDERFGKARNDDAEPLEQLTRDQANEEEDIDRAEDDLAEPDEDRDMPEDDDNPEATIPERPSRTAPGRVESSKPQEGFGRGEKPRKSKQRTKATPKPHTKTKKKSSTATRTKKSKH